MSVVASASSDPPRGQPKGLYVLFGTEAWERFSYYGMRALLTLFLTEKVGYEREDALQVYGLYTGLVYLTPLIGGYIADRYIGTRKAIAIGGILMMLGQFALAAESLLYLGLVLLIVGNGFFKPNVSTIVGSLYRQGDARRDGGFTIFYMGINLGAFFSPLVCSTLGETVGWAYGFAAAGFGMLFGLGMFAWGQRFLVTPGEHEEPERLPETFATDEEHSSESSTVPFAPAREDAPGEVGEDHETPLAAARRDEDAVILTSEPKAAGGLPRLSPRPQPELGPVFTREDWVGIGGIAGAMVAISWVMGFMWAEYGQIGILGAVAMAIGLFTAVEVFLAARRRGTPSTSAPMTPEDWHRTAVILVLAVFTIFFWMGFEQAGGTLNLFARDRTDRVLLGWEIPAGWFQSINPLLIVGLAPLYSILWGRLARTRFNPSTPVKMATGLLLLGLAFVVMGVASDLAESTGQVGPHWLAIVYLIATMGELCLSPIGLSMVTKLAPLRLASLLMGVWFLAAAVANYTAGTLEAFLLRFDLPLFWTLVATSVVSALVLYLLSPLVNRFMYGRG